MRIILARKIGFCWGVKRAIELARKLAKNSSKKIYTFGPLIHNQEVVKMLKEQGIVAYQPRITPPAVIIIRAHGISPITQFRLEKRGFIIVDATCPNVKVSEKKVKHYASHGYQVIIVGDKKHAEVISLVGYAQAGNPKIMPLLVSSSKEVKGLELPANKPVAVIAQSTFQQEEYHRIVKLLLKRLPDLIMLDTICRETIQRHREVTEMSKKVDALIVVGSHHSANTSRLAILARSLGMPTFHIAHQNDINFNTLKKYKTIGITTGTSSPDWIAQAVIKALQKYC